LPSVARQGDPAESVQDRFRVLGAVARALGNKPGDEVLECDIASGHVRKGLVAVTFSDDVAVSGVGRGVGEEFKGEAAEGIQVGLNSRGFEVQISGAI